MVRRFGPWVAAAAIILALFMRIDVGDFFDALFRADLSIYLPLICFFILAWFLIESLNLKALFRRFGHPIPYRDVMKIRGTTYLLMVINYSLGIGGIAFYLKRLKGIALSRAAGLVLFYNYSDVVSIAFMTAVGCAFTYRSDPVIKNLFLLSACFFSVYLLGAVIFRNLPDRLFLRKIKYLPVFKLFHEAKLRDFLLIAIYRAVYFSTFIFFFYLGVRAFNMDIPLLTLAGVVPAILFIGSIPITPSGLGTVQAAMLYFFKSYSTEPNILAFSIVYSASILLLRMPIGMFYLRKLGRPNEVEGGDIKDNKVF